MFDKLYEHVALTHNGRVAKTADHNDATCTPTLSAWSSANSRSSTVEHLHAALHSKSPGGSGEPSIAAVAETAIENAAIDGHGIVVDLATACSSATTRDRNFLPRSTIRSSSRNPAAACS